MYYRDRAYFYMKNLATSLPYKEDPNYNEQYIRYIEKCSKIDDDVEKELTEAGINLITIKREGEVPSKLGGKYKQFSFTRAWYYWIVRGLVPLKLAQKLYKEGPKSIRVNGHIGGIEPNLEESIYYRKEVDTHIERWYESINIKDKTEDNAYIDLYHIDTQEGLNYFVKFLKDNDV